MAKTNVVPPAIPSGFKRRKDAIFAGLAFLTVVYGLVIVMFEDWVDLRPARQFCPDTGEDDALTCTRPDLFGFQLSSGIMQVFMGSTGFLAWHVTKRAHTAIPATPEGRLFGYLEEADRLNAGIFVFQVWDFFASLSIPEHRTAVFLTHHVLSAITAWFSLEYQLLHHYAIFFGGCSEISTIFLVFCDFDVYFPASRGSIWGTFIFLCQLGFTLSFLYYRVIFWWVESIQIWKDVQYIHNNRLAEQFRPGKEWCIFMFVGMSIALGMLQLHWFLFGIVPKIVDVLSDVS